MQIVIDIPQKDYKDICESAKLLGDRNINYWERKVAKGTPRRSYEYADGMTNGDVIKAIFSVSVMDGEHDTYVHFKADRDYFMECFPSDWWNAPYKESEVNNG